jgi:hypothetical protein
VADQPGGPLGVVVVSTDPGRMSQYRMALRMAGVTAALTDDVDEAERWLRERVPVALILDQGLPRITVFRLYGLIRENEWAHDISVIFVGQEGAGGSADHYLPADASPLDVAEQAQQLAAREEPSAPPAAAPPTGAPPTAAPAAPARPDVVDVPAEPVAPAGAAPAERNAPGVGGMAAASAGAAAAGDRAAAADRPTSGDAPAAEPESPADAAVAGSGRRLDVILFRIGLVLLILGAALVFLRPEASNSPAVAPTAAPATPTRAPGASPSPAP